MLILVLTPIIKIINYHDHDVIRNAITVTCNNEKNQFLAMLVASHQSVTYRYQEFPVPGIFHFFGGIGTGIGTNWY